MSRVLSSPQDPFDYHVGRVLILVSAFSPTRRSKLDGLTKLAKLDFLLRYPVYLERLLDDRGTPLQVELRPDTAERLALESSMIRYKYGPWDDRYYPVIGRLVGLGLVEPMPGKGAVALQASDDGKALAETLATGGWNLIAGRAKALKQNLDVSGSKLQGLIYDSFPEVVDRPWRSRIGPE